MRIPRFASAFRRRLRLNHFTPAALVAMARSPSYRAPAAADLHDEFAAEPPGVDAPLEAWGAKREVTGLSMSGRAFISAEHLAVPSVRLVAVQPFMGELAMCPHLAKLRRLDLTGNRIGPVGAKALAKSPYLDGLRELILSGNNLGNDGLEAIESTTWFSNLEVLELVDNRMTASPLAVSRQLQQLDLSNNPIVPDLKLPLGLRRLTLSRCGLGVMGVANVATSGCFDGLVDLDLSFNAIGSQSACEFAIALSRNHASGLIRLNLGFNDLGDRGLELLEPLTSLEWLDLSANRITAIADFGTLTSLQYLNLTANPIGDAGALALMRSESLCNLRNLKLANCGLTNAGVQRLAISGTLGGLQSLSLAWNAIGDSAVRAIASCPDLAGLRELDLTGTHFGIAGAIALAESQHLVNLRSVILGHNERLPADAVAVLRERYTTIA